MSWVEERLTPEDLPGGAEWQYAAGDWVVKVSYAVLPPGGGVASSKYEGRLE